MKKRLLITISVVLMLMLTVGVFVFRAFGSNESAVINKCDPYNVSVVKGEKDNTVLISWDTKGRCSTYILYGEDMKDLSLVAVDMGNAVQSKSHSVMIEALLSSKTYYFSIVSEGVNYGKNGLPISFTLNSL